jgi:hypothetical protein
MEPGIAETRIFRETGNLDFFIYQQLMGNPLL